MRPECERLLSRLGIAEIERTGEELLGAVDSAGGQQLLRPDQPQAHTELGTDQVLAALTPCQREIGRLGAGSTLQHGEQLRILVVRVRTDDQHSLHMTQPP